jgi:hypothetical protein
MRVNVSSSGGVRRHRRLVDSFRCIVFAISAAALGEAVLAADLLPPMPDFAPYVSREEAVVVSIKTVAPWSRSRKTMARILCFPKAPPRRPVKRLASPCSIRRRRAIRPQAS